MEASTEFFEKHAYYDKLSIRRTERQNRLLVQTSTDIRLIQIDYTVSIQESEENMARQTHHKKLLFENVEHYHVRGCAVSAPSGWEGNGRKLTYHPSVRKKECREYVRTCNCVGPPFQFVWRKYHPYYGGFFNLLMHPEWQQIDTIPFRTNWGKFEFQRKRLIGDFYGSKNPSWDSFNFKQNRNHVPSESLDSTAFIEKELMATRITEIAFCAYLKFKHWADTEYATYIDDTKSGLFLGKLVCSSNIERNRVEQKYKKERAAFLQDMAGTGFVTFPGEGKQSHMCFLKYFDPGLGYSRVSGLHGKVSTIFVSSY